MAECGAKSKAMEMNPDADLSHPFDFGGGDIQVAATYKNLKIVFQVSSHALSFASPVWKKFLNPPFGKVDHDMRIDFTKDDGEALLILLRLAHHQIREVPRKLPYHTLLQIAVLCNQYDCVDLVRLWLKDWMQDEATESLIQGQENWLFIAWVFGRIDTFKTLADEIVRHVSFAEDPMSIDDYQNFVDDYDFNAIISLSGSLAGPLPPGIMKSIYKRHIAALKDLVAIPYKELDRYNSSINTLCTARTHRSYCDAITYGSIVMGLRKLGLGPVKTDIYPQYCAYSVSEMYEKISAIHIEKVSDRGSKSNPRHICDRITSFRNKALQVIESIPSPVLSSHIRHMEAVNKWP